MASSLKSAGGFAIGIWVRSLAIGALGFGAIAAGAHHLYATALVLAGAGAVVGLDIARSAEAADRTLAQFVDGLMAEGAERPVAPAGVRRLGDAIERAMIRLGAARAQRQQRVDFAEALADSVVAALLVVDRAGNVVLANRAARHLLGEAAGALDRFTALGPETARRLSDLRPGAQDIVKLDDGRAVLASMTGFSVPGGEPLRLIALQSVSGELDAVVLKAWEDLVRVLAHEMMNSLTPICSLSESIAGRLRSDDAGPPTEIADAVEVIARRSAGLMNFVERYRRLADLPAAARTPMPVAAFVDGLGRLMAPLMREAGVGYASSVEPVDLILDADPDLLEQAVINLLKNALDAVRGRPEAMIRLSCRLEDGRALIAVEDNGPGLAAGDAEAAFTPFFTTKAEGSGVGLTLARQIALAHGGRLEHQPRAPHGAIFRLWLPYR
jgi:two-component system nitrogen regulation sensor histidine kinase NtrY